MRQESSLLYFQDSITGSHPEPDESSPQIHILKTTLPVVLYDHEA
jgi:hypothetical protein